VAEKKRKGIMRGLNHIEIYVSSLRKSVRFWNWLLKKLGYKVHQEWKGGKSWKYGDTYIVFVQVEKKHALTRYHRKSVGLNHLAFSVESFKELNRFKNLLKRKKIPLMYDDKTLDNKRAIYFEDPDRIKVELVV
jgi:catechol 2,3-dioxygenase-like lactoylglutathione lyase family enzyme